MPEPKIVILGEALIDLVCEAPVERFAQARRFTAHFGGAAANVAMTIAARGGSVSLVGGVGDDDWGRWLIERMRAADVGLDAFVLSPGVRTPHAFVTVSADGEPHFDFHGESLAPGLTSVGAALQTEVVSGGALYLTSNTLTAPDERALTMRARELALDGGVRLVVDANFRLGRWAEPAEGIAATAASLPGAFLLKANAEEARLLGGDDDPVRAATNLVASGIEHVVVTLGAEGVVAVADGRVERCAGVAARAVNTTGAGDTFLGTLLTGLASAGFDGAALPGLLPAAVEASARAIERWGAIDD
jgi:fructokinase